MAGLLGNFKNPLAAGGLLSDPMVRLQMGAAMMGGRTLGEQFGGGLQAAGIAGQARQEKMAEQAKINQTLKFLQGSNPELAQAVEAGVLDPASAYKMHIESMKPKTPDFQEVGGQLYNPENNQWISPPVDPNAPNGDMGLAVVYMEGPNGEIVAGQTSKSGKLLPSQIPPGFKVLTPGDKAFQTAQGSAAGKDQGETVASYESVMSKMPGLEKVITELNGIADQATYTVGGNIWNETRKQFGAGPSDGAIARTKYMAMVDNQVLPMLKDTFGAAFTVTEGDALRATLGDPDKSPEEKKMVLEAFIEQKRRDVDALAGRTGNAPYQPAPGSLAAPGAVGGANMRKTSSGVTWGP